MLQGPVGPFFTRLADFLADGGVRVFKVNFNGGDAFFYPRFKRRGKTFCFQQRPRAWRGYFTQLVIERRIDAIILFGDCRFYHRVAIRVAKAMGIAVHVFEEGYIRPDYITLEPGGVNGNSSLPRDPQFYLTLPRAIIPRPQPVGPRVFYAAMLCAMLYAFFGVLLQPRFRYYRHHQNYFAPSHWLGWVRSAVRKQRYRFQDRGMLSKLTTTFSKRYFLVPLQVERDAQVVFHSRFRSVEQFIVEVVRSFAADAPRDTVLVFKHHPMDRGFNNYQELIASLARAHGLAGRLYYVHDLHLPTLLDHAKAALVVNSTVGLSSLLHGTPVKTLGHAIFDMAGLTHQGTLDDFWKNPGTINKKLHHRFRDYLIEHTQVNGNFYYLRGLRPGREYVKHTPRPVPLAPQQEQGLAELEMEDEEAVI